MPTRLITTWTKVYTARNMMCVLQNVFFAESGRAKRHYTVQLSAAEGERRDNRTDRWAPAASARAKPRELRRPNRRMTTLGDDESQPSEERPDRHGERDPKGELWHDADDQPFGPDAHLGRTRREDVIVRAPVP